jgi:hypothetical protein
MKTFTRIAPVLGAIGILFALLIQAPISLAADTTSVRRITQAPTMNDLVSAMQASDSSAAVFRGMTRITTFKQFLPRDGEPLFPFG